MRIFISSLISGFGAFRDAARSAVQSLGHAAVMAEDFGALTTSPQIACMEGVRSSDLVVLILGGDYGSVQGASGVSPTHEEYLEARGAKPILMFVQGGVEPDARQAKLLDDAQGWQTGQFRESFRSANELREKITLAIHRYELATAAGPVDPAALISAAAAALPRLDRQNHSGSALLHFSLAAGPSRTVVRPAELEDPALADAIHQEALFGTTRLFDSSKGVKMAVRGTTLVVEQEGGSGIEIDESGAILLRLPLERGSKAQRGGLGFPALIEEMVVNDLGKAIAFSNWLLERLDPTRRLAHVALATAIEADEYMSWRTQAEQDASPNSGSMGIGAREKTPVAVDKPRAALAFQVKELSEDFMVRLRRQWKLPY